MNFSLLLYSHPSFLYIILFSVCCNPITLFDMIYGISPPPHHLNNLNHLFFNFIFFNISFYLIVFQSIPFWPTVLPPKNLYININGRESITFNPVPVTTLLLKIQDEVNQCHSHRFLFLFFLFQFNLSCNANASSFYNGIIIFNNIIYFKGKIMSSVH